MLSFSHIRIAAVIVLVAITGSSQVSRGQSDGYVAVDLYTLNPPTGLAGPGITGTDPMAGSEVVGAAAVSTITGNSHAVWWTPGGTPIDLQPSNISGLIESFGVGVDGNQQVGAAGGPATGFSSIYAYQAHAMLWNGTSTAVDLQPTKLNGFVGSQANGTNGTQQVGIAWLDGVRFHAMLWNGTADSAVDLNPSGQVESDAYATDGTNQVGYAGQHAMLWSGTAASAVDLQPTNPNLSYIARSFAYAVSGGQEVGSGTLINTPSDVHALLWTGTAASAVDLNPAGYSSSIAYGTNGRQQVGFASAPAMDTHALLWSGTAGSAIDLQSLLSSNLSDSRAFSIDDAGDAFGLATDTSGTYHAIEWLAPPHTATGAIVGGSNQTTTAAGRSPTSGDVKVTFPSAGAGTFTNTNGLTTVSTLASQTAPLNFALPTPSGLVQEWDLSFNGTFTGPASLVFHFDPSSLSYGTDLSTLQIEHFTDGQWVALPGTIDPVADTITVSTSSFSPFALGAVPEPSTLAPILLGAVGLLRRRAACAR